MTQKEYSAADFRQVAAFLVALAKLHGVETNVEQALHQMAGLPARPLSLGTAAQALGQLGLLVKVRKGTVAHMLEGPTPVLVGLRTGQLLMVGRTPGDEVAVQSMDSDAPQRLGKAELQALWAGEWLVLRAEPTTGSPAAVGGAPFGIPWFWNSMKKHRQLLGEVLLASLFVQILALLTPLMFQVVIDKVLTHRSMTTLDVVVVALLLLSIFETALSAMRHYLFSHTTNRIDVELGARLFRHLLHLPLSYFESRRGGDTVARMRELDNARTFLTGQALTSWLDLAFAAVFLAVMFHYSATLASMVVAALPVFFSASWIITPLMRRKLEDKFALGAENQTFLVETVTAMETLKSHAVEPRWQREWERRMSGYVSAAFESGHLANATNQFIGLASKLLTVLLLYFGARLVIDGELSVGGLIAFNMLAGRVNAPVIKLASLWQDFTQMKVSVGRLADIMDATPEPSFNPGRTCAGTLQGRLKFDQVSFRYDNDAPEVLSDLSLDIAPGQIVGITGVSGAGKTTLLRLVQRLHVPQKGRVLVDGMDLHLMDSSWLRRQIGVVGQDTVLFNRSIRENIALSDPSVTVDEVMRSARLAGAHDFILELREGYDTVIGERGSKLSGGQRARIAIARALVTSPRLLLLDEASAALDYESERVVHDNLAEICKGRTVLIVAHRLSTLRLADRVLVLERGRLAEDGSHAALMARQGRYRSLYKAHQVLEAT